MNYDITFVGHMCYDEIIPFGGKPVVAPGSAVLCGTMVAARVGKKVAAVVKMSRKDEKILQPMKAVGVDTYLIPSDETTYSRVLHESENVDERKLTIVKTAGLIAIADVPKLNSTCVHLAGISDTEFDMALMRGLKARGYSLSADMQSFVRQVTPVTHEIQFSDVENKKDIAGMMDKLKLDVVEARILTGTEESGEGRHYSRIVGLPGNPDNPLPGRVGAREGENLLREVLQQQRGGQNGPRRHDLCSVSFLETGSWHCRIPEIRVRACFDKDGNARTLQGNAGGCRQEIEGKAFLVTTCIACIINIFSKLTARAAAGINRSVMSDAVSARTFWKNWIT